MSAMKNLIENLRGIQICMEDISRSINLNDIESPLAMHDGRGASSTTSEIDYTKLARCLTEEQLECVANQVGYSDIADLIDTNDVASALDMDLLAKTMISHLYVPSFINAMIANEKFMNTLVARLLEVPVVANTKKQVVTLVPVVPADADPSTGVEYGTQS